MKHSLQIIQPIYLQVFKYSVSILSVSVMRSLHIRPFCKLVFDLYLCPGSTLWTVSHWIWLFVDIIIISSIRCRLFRGLDLKLSDCITTNHVMELFLEWNLFTALTFHTHFLFTFWMMKMSIFWFLWWKLKLWLMICWMDFVREISIKSMCSSQHLCTLRIWVLR